MWKHFIRKSEANKVKEAIKHPHVIGNDQLFKQLSTGMKCKLIDVRDPAEYAFGHIPEAISIPLGQLAERIQKLDPQDSYILICQSGNRSDTACMLLAEKGFTHVINAYEGMKNWSYAQDRPL